MKKYRKIVLYYFTGTGNSLKAARWIGEEAKRLSIEFALHPIDKNYPINAETRDDLTLVGFLAPTHGFNIAPAMLKFITKFPRAKNVDAFILNTRAGLKIFKLFIPGLSGLARILPMMILKLNGFNIVGGLPLDMPSNWLLLHPGLNEHTVNSIVNRCERITILFIRKILNGQKVYFKMLITLPIDLTLAPIAFLYYIYGRFILAKTMIYTHKCNDCKVCIDNCPVGAIKEVNNRPSWTYSCECCMRCVNICPHVAIQTSQPILLIILIVPGILFNYMILNYSFITNLFDFRYGLSILSMVLTIVELYVLYLIIQRLLKVKIISKIFHYTSLSAYWRRYRAPGITLKDFKYPLKRTRE